MLFCEKCTQVLCALLPMIYDCHSHHSIEESEYLHTICPCDSFQGNNQAEHVCSHPNTQATTQASTKLNIFALTQIPRSRVPASILGSGRKKASINSIRLSCKIYYILLFILLSLSPQKWGCSRNQIYSYKKWNFFCFQGSVIKMSQQKYAFKKSLFSSFKHQVKRKLIRFMLDMLDRHPNPDTNPFLDFPTSRNNDNFKNFTKTFL